MEHLAIMRKSWKLTDKILNGTKKIESRWYKNKYPPWNKIKTNDIVYFKDSGDSVRIKTKVRKVIQYQDLNLVKVKDILERYGDYDGIEAYEHERYFEMFKDKKYCILIFLEYPEKIEAFDINKKGFWQYVCLDLY